ncbi:hypothetical protein P5704_028000 (plasmid) [Pseudomonas sp. FeN3W]|nr:hypothetical protein P5704_028000 [Pseudomonas sp. FeN3W]
MNSHARQAMLNKANTISALQSLAGETDFCGVFMFIVTQGFCELPALDLKNQTGHPRFTEL